MLSVFTNRVLLALALFAFIIFIGKTAMAIEESEYTVIEKEEDFEIRQYQPFIVAETFVDGEFSEVGNIGFRRPSRCHLRPSMPIPKHRN